MLQYLEKLIEETKSDYHFALIKEPLKTAAVGNATSWSDILKENGETFYLDTVDPGIGHPIPQDKIQAHVRWSEIFSFFNYHS